jgi:hypothetical protein
MSFERNKWSFTSPQVLPDVQIQQLDQEVLQQTTPKKALNRKDKSQ